MAALPRKQEADPSPNIVDLGRDALLLDVDGTLLDIAPTPDAVVVPPMLREILADLIERTDGAVALVSGRRIATLDRLFAPLVAPAIGGHGAEMRLAASEPLLETSVAMLSRTLRRELRLLADADPRVLVEDKAHSLALHYRLVPEMESVLKVAVGEIVAAEFEWRGRVPARQACDRHQAKAIQQRLGRARADVAAALCRPQARVRRRRHHGRVGVCDFAWPRRMWLFRRQGGRRHAGNLCLA